MLSRNNADLIIPGLWLGNSTASMDEKFLKENKIQSVFNCTKDLPFHSNIRRRFRVPIDDNLRHEEIRNLELWSFEAIYKLTKEHKNGNVLVHCYAGMQRSAAVVAIFLIANYKMKKDDVISFIKNKRNVAFYPFVNFNRAIESFQEQYEKNILPKIMD